MSQVSKNIFWLTLSRALALGLLFLAYTQLFRYLGVFGSGQYQFVLSYVMIFSTVVDFGVLQFITKKMSENEQDTKKYFQNFLAFETAVALVLYVLLLGIAYFRQFEPVVFQAVAITGLGMVVNALTYPYLAVMTVRQDLKKVALINFLNSLVNISIIFAAIYFKKHIVFLASIQLVFGILDILLYNIFIRKYLPNPGALSAILKFRLGNIGDILKQAWPFALLVGFSAIYNRIDVILIARVLDYTQTGFYTAAYKFFDLLNFFPASVSHTLFPFLAALMAKGLVGDVRQNLEKYLKLMIVVAMPVAVGGTLLAPKLIGLVAGQEFAPAAPVLSILIWAVAILFIYIPVNSLVISQLTKKALVVTGVNVVVNVVGNILLLPILGIKAAAIMTVASELLQGIFYFYFVKTAITQFNFWGILKKPLVASLIMGLSLWPLKELSLLLSVPVGAVVYVLILLALGFVTAEDIKIVKNLSQA
jgi:O-antigen/teichoic acid export membrane protein